MNVYAKCMLTLYNCWYMSTSLKAFCKWRYFKAFTKRWLMHKCCFTSSPDQIVWYWALGTSMFGLLAVVLAGPQLRSCASNVRWHPPVDKGNNLNHENYIDLCCKFVYYLRQVIFLRRLSVCGQDNSMRTARIWIKCLDNVGIRAKNRWCVSNRCVNLLSTDGKRW